MAALLAAGRWSFFRILRTREDGPLCTACSYGLVIEERMVTVRFGYLIFYGLLHARQSICVTLIFLLFYILMLPRLKLSYLTFAGRQKSIRVAQLTVVNGQKYSTANHCVT
jgi:hypothetical protein